MAVCRTTGSYIKIGLPPIPETPQNFYPGGAIVAGHGFDGA